MANVKATDLIEYTRASKGHALAKISYGSNELPSASFSTILTGTWDGTEFVDTVGSQTRPGITSNTSLTNGTTYALFINITDITGATQVRIDGLDGTDRLLGEGDHRVSFISNGGTPRVRLEDTSTSVNDGFTLQSALEAKEVLFNQPDGTLQLFQHPDNIPRIEYDADGNLLGLLIEEARTNLLRGSEAFDNSEGGFYSISQMLAFGSGSTADATAAPNSTVTADLIVPNTTSSNSHYIRQQKSGATIGSDYTMSVYVKAAGYTTCSLRLIGTDAPIANFDLSAETTNQSSATIANVGNGWYRCTLTGEATSTSVWHYIYPNQQATFAGDGTSGIYIWGAQLEAGSFPTSYIKTTGNTASRSADVAKIDVDQFGYNQNEGTVVAEFDSNGSDGSDYPRVFALSNTSGSDLARFLINPTNTTTVSVITSSSGVALTGWSGSISPNTAETIALAIKQDSFAASLSGASTQTDASGNMPAKADLLAIGTQTNLGNNYLNGHIKSIKYFPKRLSNAKLQELTS